MDRRRFLQTAASSAAALAAIPTALELETRQSPATAEAATPTTVTFWEYNANTPALSAWKGAIAKFEAANPDVKINFVLVPWAEETGKSTTAISTGTAPDVSMMGNDQVAWFSSTGALAPLESYFQAWSKEVGHDITNDFYPGDHLYYHTNGHWYACPVSEETRLIYYRKSMFKSAGLDPNNPKLDTFQDMLNAALKLTTKHVYGLGISGDLSSNTVQTFMSVYLGWGAHMLDAKGNCGFDTPQFRAALTFYTDLYRKYHVTPPDTPVYDYAELEPLFQAGKLAMHMDSGGLWTTITDKALLSDIGLVQIPKGPVGRFGFLGGFPLVIWAQSKVKDAAWRFVRFICDPAGPAFTPVCLGNGAMPGRISSASQSPWTQWPNSVFVNQLKFAYPYQYPAPEFPQMGAIEVDSVQTAVQNVLIGKSTVDQATKDLVSHINTILHP